jgi:hypothetical protein
MKLRGTDTSISDILEHSNVGYRRSDVGCYHFCVGLNLRASITGLRTPRVTSLNLGAKFSGCYITIFESRAAKAHTTRHDTYC